MTPRIQSDSQNGVSTEPGAIHYDRQYDRQYLTTVFFREKVRQEKSRVDSWETASRSASQVSLESRIDDRSTEKDGRKARSTSRPRYAEKGSSYRAFHAPPKGTMPRTARLLGPVLLHPCGLRDSDGEAGIYHNGGPTHSLGIIAEPQLVEAVSQIVVKKVPRPDLLRIAFNPPLIETDRSFVFIQFLVFSSEKKKAFGSSLMVGSDVGQSQQAQDTRLLVTLREKSL